MSPLLLLPPELLEQVLSSLSFKDLAACCQVCSTLQTVARELIPATHLIIDSDGPSSEKRRGHALGQYRLLGTKCNGRAAYQQLHTVQFRGKRDTGRKIFLSFTGEAWEVSEALGESRGNIRCVTSSLLPPPTGWEFFQWQGKGGEYLPDPNLKLTTGRIKPCSQIRVNVPEILYEAFFPTSLSSRRTPPPFQATFFPVELWCSGRPVYQMAREDVLMLEEDKDKDSGTSGKKGASKNTDVKEKEDKSQEDEKEKIDDGGIGKAVREATTGRGGRLLVRGGFWEVQLEKKHRLEFPLLQSTKGRLHPSSSGDWQVKDHAREWDEVAVDQGGLWRKTEVEVTSDLEESKSKEN